ncbi:MAG: DNA cytosine methyltransferase [Chloroflexi bacterium]|nr:DNA cytosine methyltransferase [Chloroflexota bacterium]
MVPALTNTDKLTFVDLFSGAGGLSLGFLHSGFQCICALDSNAAAITTYQHNFKDQFSRVDITEATELPLSDVIVGGPPCQGFSSAGLRRLDDSRSTLVRVFSELIVRHKPKAFVFENVEGFLTAHNGDRVFDLLGPLVDAGYRIHLRKINAANYGIPQHRKRVIAVGGLGWDPTFPEPTHMAFGAPGSSISFRHLPMCPTLADALVGLPEPLDAPPGLPQGHFTRPVSQRDAERIRLLLPGQSMKHLPVDLWHDSFRRRAYRRVRDGVPSERRGGAPYGLRRLHIDEPSKAITSGAISEFVHPLKDRFLTLRECARIQTFPDDFEFFGTVAEAILQIGNAVPPVLGEAIARNLRSDLLKALPATHSNGALLSFVPTASTGMSPVLEKLTARVNKCFQISPANSYLEQRRLWP